MSKIRQQSISLQTNGKPLIPAAKPGGRPREVEIWNILNAILYLYPNCRWRSGWFPSMANSLHLSQLAHRRDMGEHSWPPARVGANNEREASPSEVIVDSQSVKPLRWSLKQSAMTQPNRLRRKPHGWYLGSGVAGICERSECGVAKCQTRSSSASNAWAKPSHESTPSGSMGGWWHSVPDLGHGRLPLDCPSRITTGADQRLCLAQKRWVVERTFGWLMGSRRLVRDYDCHKPRRRSFTWSAWWWAGAPLTTPFQTSSKIRSSSW